MNDNFLKTVMDNIYTRTITVCGSMRYFALIQKYEAYYTIKNNIVFAPVNYFSIRNEINTNKEISNYNKNMLFESHKRKISISEAIIVVVGDNYYVGEDTENEIEIARGLNKIILFTNIPKKYKHKYYFNHDLTYPLYMLKED